MLSPSLYAKLVQVFGDVRVSNEGEPFTARVGKDMITGETKLEIINRGETYAVNCPFCNDTRNRLWINHRWNTFDSRTCTRNLFLAKCFNEDCIADRGVRALTELIFGNSHTTLPAPEYDSTKTSVKTVIPRLPQSQPLVNLPSTHHARTYLESRNFDPDYLSKEFGIRFCGYPENGSLARATNRLLIPAYMNGNLVGWQARYIGERDWKDKSLFVPKYFSMPGFRKSACLYNYDSAKEDPTFVIVCEGPSDVWRIGSSAVAIFGKDLSTIQRDLIINTWGKGTIIVMLDSDATVASNKVYNKLKEANLNVYNVSLEGLSKDPGDMSEEEVWDLITKEMEKEDAEKEAVGTRGN